MRDGSLHNAVYDLIFVCETWLSSEISDGLLLYKYAYNLSCCDRSGNQRDGGVCIFVKQGLKYVIIPILQEFAELKILCVDIIFSLYKQHFIVLYKPPFYNCNLTSKLLDCLERLCDVECAVTACDDFNFGHIDLTNEFIVIDLPMHEATFAAFITNNGLTQLVKEPTRNENILDLLLVDDPFAFYNVAEIPPFCTSDHNAVTWHASFPFDFPDVCTPSSFDFKHAKYA